MSAFQMFSWVIYSPIYFNVRHVIYFVNYFLSLRDFIRIGLYGLLGLYGISHFFYACIFFIILMVYCGSSVHIYAYLG